MKEDTDRQKIQYNTIIHTFLQWYDILSNRLQQSEPAAHLSPIHSLICEALLTENWAAHIPMQMIASSNQVIKQHRH